jgi:hypothetical protein
MLSLEPLLTARLEELTGFKGVHGLPELMAAEKASRPSPCLYLIFDGYRPLESTSRGKAARVQTRWLVVISVKHASNVADGSPARSTMAPLVKGVLGHLLGWQPAPGSVPLEIAPGPRPDFAAGCFLFPLAFTTDQVVKAD